MSDTAQKEPPRHVFADQGSFRPLRCMGCGISSIDPRATEPCPKPVKWESEG